MKAERQASLVHAAEKGLRIDVLEKRSYNDGQQLRKLQSALSGTQDLVKELETKSQSLNDMLAECERQLQEQRIE